MTDDKYCLSKANAAQVRLAMQRLKEISAITFVALLQQSTFHAHVVDWARTREPGEFPYPEANEFEAYQFALLGVNGQKARVYGAYDGETFYVVWIDLNHHIWPSFKRNT